MRRNVGREAHELESERSVGVGIKNKLPAGEIRMSVIAIVKSDGGKHLD